jgi:hypothetical protein
MMKFDAFISYPHQNKAVADAACAMVEAAGIRCWSAPRDVDPGDEWAEAIVNAIDHCTVMILIFSSHANQSKQVRREVQRAFDRDVPVVPFRVENVMPEKSLAYYMGPVHWLDALTPPLEEHLQKLLARVKALVEAKPATGVGGETPLPAHAVAAIVADETTVAAADGACHATGEAHAGTPCPLDVPSCPDVPSHDDIYRLSRIFNSCSRCHSRAREGCCIWLHLAGLPEPVYEAA